MANLRVIRGHSPRLAYELANERPSIIGRSADADVILLGNGVSRRHARIVPDGGRFVLEDLNSTNGTYQNGERILSRAELQDGDRLTIASAELDFFVAGETVRGESDTSRIQLVGPRHSDTVTAGAKEIVAELEPGRATESDTVTMTSGDYLHAILHITDVLNSGGDLQNALATVLDVLFEVFPQSTAGAVLLPDHAGRLVPLASRASLSDSDHGMSTRHPDAGRLRETTRSGDAGVWCGAAAARRSLFGMDARCVLRAPLATGVGRNHGLIQLESRRRDGPFSDDSLDLLKAVAAVVDQAAARAEAQEARLEYNRREQQLRTAREIQRRMVPQPPTAIPGYEIQQYYAPADLVGGDYVGYFELPGARHAVGLADITGKGLAAALTMAEFGAEVRHCVETSATVKCAVQRLNEFCLHGAQTLVTFLFCVLHPRRHVVTIVNAGHCPPLMRRQRRGTTERIGMDQSGLPLGVRREEEYRVTNVHMAPRDRLLLYTDGLTDAMNPQQELYGRPRVQSVLGSSAGTAQETVHSLLQDVDRFRAGAVRTDDTCVVCLYRKGA